MIFGIKKREEVHMGLMDFLKKKSDSGLGSEAASFDIGNTDLNNPGHNMNSQEINPAMNYGEHMGQATDFSAMSGMNNNTFGQSSMQQSMPQGSDISKDLEVISLKLDAIKSELDAMNQRLKSLESIAEREQLKTNKKWY
jgi:hypothetical protein